jgi:hypothetical protein
VSRLELEDGVRSLLESKLDSFEKLEIMERLHASGQRMSRDEIEAACGLRSDVVVETLVELEQLRLVERDRSGQIHASGSLSPELSTLLQLYRADRVAVLSKLSSIAMQRIRSMAARTFADAFVFRRKRGDDG